MSLISNQQDLTLHLLEWLKSQTMTILNAGEEIGQQELSIIVMNA